MAVDASKFLLFISDDGTETGNRVQVEKQDSITVNPGKSTQTVNHKDGQTSSFVTDAGFTATFSFTEASPGPGQELIWAAHDANANIFCWFESKTGGNSYRGQFIAAISSGESSNEGLNAYEASFSIQGAVDRYRVGGS